jgi:hypothetical protein
MVGTVAAKRGRCLAVVQFLLECMTGSWSDKVPALIGGGVRQVIGRGSEGKGKGPGVTVMGAVLPGVKVSPTSRQYSTIRSLHMLIPLQSHCTLSEAEFGPCSASRLLPCVVMDRAAILTPTPSRMPRR